MYKRFLKRILDFLLSIILLILLSPLLLIISIVLLIENEGKIFFHQERPGLNGKIFTILKFKTMNDKKDKNGNLLPDMERITFIGKIVRNFSFDEIPQLINVIKGEMSLIGPRPLLPEYLPLYSREQARRHDVLPGITGWAQVNGRNTISWKQKFELDVWYVDNLSFKSDIKIIFLTLKKIFRSKDINASDDLTMERFNGQN